MRTKVIRIAAASAAIGVGAITVGAVVPAIAQEDPPATEHRVRHPRLAAAFRIAAETIGIDAETLRQAVADGQSVAEVATANGVDPQAVVDALVAAGQELLLERSQRFVDFHRG